MIKNKNCIVCNKEFSISIIDIDSSFYLYHCSGICYEKTLVKYKY